MEKSYVKQKNQMHFAARNCFFTGYADKLYGEVIPLDNVGQYNRRILSMIEEEKKDAVKLVLGGYQPS
jgi:hypothetical protein